MIIWAHFMSPLLIKLVHRIYKYTLYINTFQNNHFWNHLGNQRSYRKSDSSSAFLGCQDPFGLSPLVLKFQSCSSDGLGDMDQQSFEILNFWYNQIVRTILTTFNSCKNYKSRFLLYIIWHLEKKIILILYFLFIF